ncbi:hypothetical protein D3C72_2346710 [compost metagenome]
MAVGMGNLQGCEGASDAVQGLRRFGGIVPRQRVFQGGQVQVHGVDEQLAIARGQGAQRIRPGA